MSIPDTPFDPTEAPTLALDDDWEDDDVPITPRARMPRPTKLLLVLAVAAAAFAGGIFAQRHWGAGSAGSGSGAAARLAAARGFSGQGATQRFGGTGGGATGSGVPGGFADATIGQVAYLKGTTLYITDSNGNTIKVAVPKGTPVTKSVTTTIKGVRPGDTVVVRGTKATNGTVKASSVSVGGAAGGATNGGGATGFGQGSGTGLGTTGSGAATGFGGSPGG